MNNHVAREMIIYLFNVLGLDEATKLRRAMGL